MLTRLVQDAADQGRDSTDDPERFADFADQVVEHLLRRVYDRGVVVEDFTNAWDDFLHNDDDHARHALAALGRVRSRYATYWPSLRPDDARWWDDVLRPLFFDLTSAFSFGLIDEEFFSTVNRLVRQDGNAAALDYILTRIALTISDTLSLGAVSGIVNELQETPASVKSVLTGAIKGVFPVEEVKVIFRWAIGRVTGAARSPDFGEAAKAFFAGVLKAIAVIGTARRFRLRSEVAHGQTAATRSAPARTTASPQTPPYASGPAPQSASSPPKASPAGSTPKAVTPTGPAATPGGPRRVWTVRRYVASREPVTVQRVTRAVRRPSVHQVGDVAASATDQVRSAEARLAKATIAQAQNKRLRRKTRGVVPDRDIAPGVTRRAAVVESGWRRALGVTPEQVREYCERIKYRLRKNAMDSTPKDPGWEGRHNASHTEKKLAVRFPDEPIAINNTYICQDCIDFFRAETMHFQRARTVITRTEVHVFPAGGGPPTTVPRSDVVWTRK